MKKLNIFLAVAVIAVFVLLVKYGGQNGGPVDFGDVKKIGVILPLTGGMANTGADAKIGIEMAKEKLGRSDIELIFEDDQFAPKESINAFNRLKNIENVVAIIGPLNGSSIESVRGLAENARIPVVTPYGAGNSIGDFVYKNSIEGDEEAKTMVDKASELGYKRLAIIYMQNDFGQKYLKAFKEKVATNGATLVAEEGVPFGVLDFRTSLTKIKASKPDAIYIVHTNAGIAEVAKQSKELGVGAKLLSLYATESNNIVDVAGAEALEGLLYTNSIPENGMTQKQRDFIADFIKKTGKRPEIIAFNAYDIYEMLVGAIDSCDSDTECINEYFKTLNNFEGVGGKISIENGRLKREIFFKKIVGGEFVDAI